MNKILTLAGALALAVAATPALAGHGGHHGTHEASPYVAIENEPAPKLFVDAPLPGPLAARGAVFIQYRTENFRIVPVFGANATDVSPRIGHLHVTVNDLPWHWADASDDGTLVLVGLPPGEHKVLVELADPQHRVITAQTVTFTVPAPK
jgi:hypothetical protein